MTKAHTDYRDHPLVKTFVDRFAPGSPALQTTIDSRDEMLEFQRDIGQGNLDRALLNYFRTGAAISATYLDLLRWHFGEDGPTRLLDFASGFGRVTRFLCRKLSPENLTVCEISEGASEFQATTFGVSSLEAALRPEDFRSDERFDCILVTSLFTHLPEATFGAWLSRLLELLRPGGLLLFTVHDVSMLLPDRPIPESGHHFEATSESQMLETSEYGSLWVSEAWVREQIQQIAPEAMARRIPFAICDYQDLWLVSLGETPLGEPPTPAPDPQGFMELCEQRGALLHLEGWAMARSPGAQLQSVHIELAGSELAILEELPTRPDVESIYLSQRPTYVVGWQAEIELPSGVSPCRDVLAVTARDAGGSEHALWISTLEGALLHSFDFQLSHWRAEDRKVFEHMERELEDAHRRVAATETRMEAMKQSRFWRLRELWFGFKRRFALTRDE